MMIICGLSFLGSFLKMSSPSGLPPISVLAPSVPHPGVFCNGQECGLDFAGAAAPGPPPPACWSYPTLSASSHLSRIRTCPGSHFHKGTRVLFNCSIYCPQKRQYTNISSTATAFQSLPISSSLVACSLPSRIFVGWCKPPVIQSSVSRRTVQ